MKATTNATNALDVVISSVSARMDIAPRVGKIGMDLMIISIMILFNSGHIVRPL